MIRKRQITDRACIVMFLSVAAFATILLAVLGRGSAPTQRKKSNYSQTLQRISANKKTPPKRKAPRPKNIWVEARTEAFKKINNAKWTLKFEDKFQRDELGDNWKAVDGEWSISDGKLVCTAKSSDSSIKCLATDFDGNLRIEYTCSSTKLNDDALTDLSLMTHIVDLKENFPVTGGVLFRFGSYDNTWCGFSTRGMLEPVRKPVVKIIPGKSYRVVATRLDRYLSMTINDEIVFAGYIKPSPDFLNVNNKRAGGFYVYNGLSEFDNFEVYSAPFDSEANQKVAEQDAKELTEQAAREQAEQDAKESTETKNEPEKTNSQKEVF